MGHKIKPSWTLQSHVQYIKLVDMCFGFGWAGFKVAFKVKVMAVLPIQQRGLVV